MTKVGSGLGPADSTGPPPWANEQSWFGRSVYGTTSQRDKRCGDPFGEYLPLCQPGQQKQKRPSSPGRHELDRLDAESTGLLGSSSSEERTTASASSHRIRRKIAEQRVHRERTQSEHECTPSAQDATESGAGDDECAERQVYAATIS